MLYECFAAVEQMEIAELETSYSDYPRLRQRKPYRQQLAYWREHLAGVPTLRLPTDHARPKVRGFRRATAVSEMAEGLVLELREMARRQGSTPHLVLLAGFAALLQRYSGQEDVVIATPIAKADGAAAWLLPRRRRARSSRPYLRSDTARAAGAAPVAARWRRPHR